MKRWLWLILFVVCVGAAIIWSRTRSKSSATNVKNDEAIESPGIHPGAAAATAPSQVAPPMEDAPVLGGPLDGNISPKQGGGVPGARPTAPTMQTPPPPNFGQPTSPGAAPTQPTAPSQGQENFYPPPPDPSGFQPIPPPPNFPDFNNNNNNPDQFSPPPVYPDSGSGNFEDDGGFQPVPPPPPAPAPMEEPQD
jgi:hypothetical protein